MRKTYLPGLDLQARIRENDDVTGLILSFVLDGRRDGHRPLGRVHPSDYVAVALEGDEIVDPNAQLCDQGLGALLDCRLNDVVEPTARDGIIVDDP